MRYPRARFAVARPVGFTLVELMVVLVLVGLAGTAVLLTAPGADPLRAQSDAFATGLQRAREEALLGARSVEVTASAEGFGFARERLGQWEPLRANPFGNRLWQDGVAPELPRDQAQVAFRFEPTGLASGGPLHLRHGDDGVRVSVQPTGEVTLDAAPR